MNTYGTNTPFLSTWVTQCEKVTDIGVFLNELTPLQIDVFIRFLNDEIHQLENDEIKINHSHPDDGITFIDLERYKQIKERINSYQSDKDKKKLFKPNKERSSAGGKKGKRKPMHVDAIRTLMEEMNIHIEDFNAESLANFLAEEVGGEENLPCRKSTIASYFRDGYLNNTKVR